MWLFFLVMFYNPYVVISCHNGESDLFYASSPKEAIADYMDKWYPVLGSCGGPFCVEVDGKEYNIAVERKFVINRR